MDREEYLSRAKDHIFIEPHKTPDSCLEM